MEPPEDPEEEPSLAEADAIDRVDKTPKDNDDTDELARFRQRWKEELEQKQHLKTANPSSNHTPDHTPPTKRKDKEDEAASLFWMGVAAEQSGDMNAAILYYRQAIQLEPDIELKLYGQPAKNGVSGEAWEDGEASDDSTSQLTESLQCANISCHSFCEVAVHRRETHISALPVEIMRYILRWVVSAQLDMRSLEQVSKVCKGFYALAREPSLWRAACRRLWGDQFQACLGGNWRKMFISTPHLHFNGVYISKTSYVRPGERSLDSFYKPYHTVVYYRYLRFFPDGSVMYVTSPHEPAAVVGSLSHKHASESIRLGKYVVHGDKVLVDVLTYQCYGTTQHRGRGKGRSKQSEVTHEERLHMEFSLLSVGKRMRYNHLKWIEHYCHSLHRPTGEVQLTHFNIDYMYTPFHFSRVKRFTTNSIGILS